MYSVPVYETCVFFVLTVLKHPASPLRLADFYWHRAEQPSSLWNFNGVKNFLKDIIRRYILRLRLISEDDPMPQHI